MKRIQTLFLCILFLQVLNAQTRNLAYFLDRGLQNSPLLKDYQNQLRSGQIDSMRLKAGQGIQVNAVSTNAYAPVIEGWGYDEVKTDIYEVSAMLGISKDIIGRNNLRNQYQTIGLQNQSIAFEGSLSEKDLKKEIVSQYILTYGDQQHYVMNAEVLEILRQEDQIVKELTEEGQYKQTEYLSLLVNLRQQELVTSQSFSQLKTELETLNHICGIFDTVFFEIADPGLVVHNPAAIQNTIFYRQFEIDSLKLVNEDLQIDFNYRPKLSVYADGGYLSSMAYDPWNNFGMSAGLSLTVPIYDGNQRKMQHDKVQISESTRLNYVNFFAGQYKQQIAMLTRQLSENEALISKINEQMTYAKSLVDASRLLLDTGDISVTDYLLSMNNYITAKYLLLDNRLTRYNIINELDYWSE